MEREREDGEHCELQSLILTSAVRRWEWSTSWAGWTQVGPLHISNPVA